MDTYKNNFKKGIYWTTIQQITVSVIGIIRLMILARLLDKSDFGLFAIITMLIGFTSIFTDLGITVSLYHKKNITKIQYSSLYWFNLLLNIILYLLLILSTPLFVLYFKEEILVYLIPLTGINLIFQSLGKHFKVYAEKEFRFKEIAIINILTNILSLLLVTFLAYKGYGIYSLIYSILFTSLLSSILYYTLMKGKYKLIFKLKFNIIKNFLKIGMYQTGSQILDYISSQIDVIIIGGLLNTEILGIYNLIKQLTLRIYRLLSNIINKVSIPIFSSFNDNNELLKIRFLNIVKQVSLISSIIYLGLAFMSKEIIYIMYGKEYMEYHKLFALFSVIYYITSIIATSGILIIAKGKTKYGFYWTIYRIFLSSLLIIVFGYLYEITGIIIGLLIFSVQSLFTFWAIVLRKVQKNISFQEYLNSYFFNSFSALIIYIILLILSFKVPVSNLTLLFFLKFILYILAVSVYLYFFKKELILKLKKQIINKNL